MDPMAQTNKRKLFAMNPIIVVLGLVSLFTDLSSNMIVPILPLYLTSVLHVQVQSIGIIEGIAESTASILKLFSGWITDRVGKYKLLMLIGYGLSNLTKPLFAISASWEHQRVLLRVFCGKRLDLWLLLVPAASLRYWLHY